MIATKKFQPFKRRIKLLRGFEGAFYGLAVASIVGIVWVILDWKAVIYFEWLPFAILVASCVVIGTTLRLFGAVDDLSVARSIDRRAKLKDRLGTSAELESEDGVFSQLLAEDANSHLDTLKPQTLYPFKLRRFHFMVLAGLGFTIASVFLMNTKVFLPKDVLADKESMQKESKRLEELRKAIFDDKTTKESISPELMALQKDLQKLQKDYEKARIDPKEAMLRAEELAKKADELAKNTAQQSLDDVQKAESMKEKMEKEALKNAGLEKANFEDVKMSQEDFNQKMDSAQQRNQDAQSKVDELQKKLDALKAQMNKPGMDEKAKKELQDQINKTEKELAEAKKNAEQAQKDFEAMQLSKEAREALNKIYNDPLWKQIQEAAAKLKQDAEQKAGQKGGKKLTKEEREELRKKMEEFLKQMADEDFRKEYLKKLLESLKAGTCSGQCTGLGMGLGLGLGLGQGNPSPGPDNDTMISDTGHVNKGKPEQGKGKGNAIYAPTERDNTRPGLEMTFEIKAPTFKGTKSSVPYQKVLPSYTKKAESALSQNEIPKEHQQRVKRYFESLKK